MSSEQMKAAEGQKKPPPSTPGGDRKMTVFDKSLTATANLVRLLPTGTTMVFETLAPSFTNHGHCYHVNHVFSWGLIVFLSSVCVFLSFTDSIIDPADGNTYYGLALPSGFCKGFYIFNYGYYDRNKRQSIAEEKGKNDNEEDPFTNARWKQKNDNEEDPFTNERWKRRVRPRDFVHALFRALVFVAIAFDDAELQACLLGRRMTEQWKEFLVNMPLATGFLASFVFMIFPSTRNGIGYDVGANSAAHHDKKNSNPADAPASSRNVPPPASQEPAGASDHNREVRIESIDPLTKNSRQITIAGPGRQITVADGRVAPSTSYELDSVV